MIENLYLKFCAFSDIIMLFLSGIMFVLNLFGTTIFFELSLYSKEFFYTTLFFCSNTFVIIGSIVFFYHKYLADMKIIKNNEVKS